MDKCPFCLHYSCAGTCIPAHPDFHLPVSNVAFYELAVLAAFTGILANPKMYKIAVIKDIATEAILHDELLVAAMDKRKEKKS